MSRDRARKRWRSFVVVLVTVVVVGAALTMWPIADIRPPSVRGLITPAMEADGRRLLARMQDAHGGLDRFMQLRTTRVAFRDVWPSALMARFGSPWEPDDGRLAMRFANASDDPELVFLDGPRAGTRWGVIDGAPYTETLVGERTEAPTAAFRMTLEAYEYFFELPFRIDEATVVAHAGTRALDGKTYDLVYATWHTAEPQLHLDQYVLWIDRETRLLSYAEHTVRDAFKAVTSTMHFEDFRPVAGLTLPFRMTAGPDPGETGDVMHRLEVESYFFGEPL